MKPSKSFQILSFLFAIVASSLINIQPAKASESVLLDNGLEWAQGGYDTQGVVNGETQWIGVVVTASNAATVSKVELYMSSTNALHFAGSTVSFYVNPTSAPKQSGDLLGTLTFAEFRLQPSQTDRGAAVFTGSVVIPSAGQYWFRFGNLPPNAQVGYRFGNISNQTGPWSAYQGTPNVNFFDGGNNFLANYYPKVRITGSAGVTVTAPISLDAGTLIYRQVKVVTATTTVEGKVTFKVNGKKLPGCINKRALALNSYITTCSYRPSTRGHITISTTFNPTDASYIGTTSTAERLFVGNRTGKRAG